LSKGFVPERRGFDLRLDGARQHLKALDLQVSKWKRKAYRRLTKDSANAGEKEVWVEIREQPPQEFSLLISDFLHNMRACLDNLMFDLAIAGNRGMPLAPDIAKDIGFPIYGATPLPRFNRKRTFGPAILNATTIIERLQPHARGDDYASDPLFHLHELNRFDKHRHLHAVAFAYLSLGLGVTTSTSFISKLSALRPKVS
jgi:hypothetical protein